MIIHSMNKYDKTKIQHTVDYIKSTIDLKPQIGLILGSGLGSLGDEIEGGKIPFTKIPNFPPVGVIGHKGNMVIGEFCGKNVVALQGRYHLYEGHTVNTVTYPVKVMQELGAQKLIVTNAAGGINISYQPGDLMLIQDHINLTGENPLIGEDGGSYFIDLSQAYSQDLMLQAVEVSRKCDIKIQRGTYVGVKGPSYETPAEVRMLRTLGGDAVGMSTVSEVIMANYLSMDVLGISCITNMAAGILHQKLSHEEVLKTSSEVKEKFSLLIKEIIGQL